MEDLKGAWYPSNAHKSEDVKKKEDKPKEELLMKRLDIDLIKDIGGSKDAR